MYLWFGAPGPLELLILGLICLVFLGVIVAAVVIPLVISRRSGSGGAGHPNLYPCPDCGNLVSFQAPSCPKCGRKLTDQGQT